MASVLGFISTLAGGMLSDAYHTKSYWTKAIISILSGLLATPAIVICTAYQSSFALSISMLCVNYITAESWGSPTITMLQDVTPSETIGFSISAYLFLTTISGMVGTAALSMVNNVTGAATNPAKYGYNLAIFSFIAYAGSLPFFYLAGRSYVQKMREADRLAAEKK